LLSGTTELAAIKEFDDMPIKALVFDCGGVVLRHQDGVYYERWEARLGLQPGELEERLWSGPLWARAELGQLSEAEFWVEAGRELELSPCETEQLAHDLWQSWGVDPGVLALVDRARDRFRVAMLSNATDALEHQLSHVHGIADRFDPIINSARCGIAKPSPEIYQLLLERLQIEAREVVFIDDRAENVTAAAALGMHVIWFVHPQELERQLAPYLRLEMLQVDTTRS
jgi:putative hydrolase of the HAD superfamily